MPKTLPKRSEVPVEHTWDVYSIFPSDQVWEAAYKGASEAIAELGRYEGRLGESGATLLEALRTRDRVQSDVLRVYQYANLQLEGDIANQTYIAFTDQATALYARAAGAAAYFEPEILAIEPSRLEQLISDTPPLRPTGTTSTSFC